MQCWRSEPSVEAHGFDGPGMRPTKDFARVLDRVGGLSARGPALRFAKARLAAPAPVRRRRERQLRRNRHVRLAGWGNRSEEHTSELQSRGHLVCRLLLEKKKKKNNET